MKTKERIIESAFKVFLAKGYNNCSMSDLVNETNLSKGAYYHHFKGKEDLYKSVIDTYFISYYDQINWNEAKDLNIKEIEHLIKNMYFQFIPEIMKLTDKGMSRYFIMFFEAYHIYPNFKIQIRDTYQKLKILIENAFVNEQSKDPSTDAIRLIAKYEGLIFWFSIYPEEKIIKLIEKI